MTKNISIICAKILILLSLVTLFQYVNITYAANDLDSFNVTEYLTVGEGENAQKHSYFNVPDGVSPIAQFMLILINYMIMIIGTMSIAMIVLGGLVLIVSQGNESHLEKGKDLIVYAIIGVIVAFSSYAISIFVQSIFYQ